MKLKRSNIAIFALAITMIIGGLDIAIEGQMRTLLLGNERYLVGGTLMLFGIYCLILGVSRWQRHK